MAVDYTHLPKKATTVSLAETLLAEAAALGIDVSQAAEAGVARAVADRRTEAWLKDNAEAIAYYNTQVEQHGMLLEEFRIF